LRRGGEKQRRKVGLAEVLEDLASGRVLGDQNRNVEPLLQDRARGIPPSPRIRLLRRVEDADDALPPPHAQPPPSAAAPPPPPSPGRPSTAIGSWRVRRASAASPANSGGITSGGRTVSGAAGVVGGRDMLFPFGEMTGPGVEDPPPSAPAGYPFACVSTAFLMCTGWLGRSLAPRGALTILSATSMPEATSPNTVYWPSRNVESLTTMKNWDEAE